MPLKPLVLIAALAAASVTEPLPADDDASARVAALLEAGWKPSIKGLAAAEALYQEMHEAGRVDPRISYAFALVQMRNLKYDAAKQFLDRVLAESKTDAAARRAKIWVLMVTRDYAGALVELQALVKQFAAPPADEAAEADAARAIEFAGRVMGYIDGPAATALAEHVRADYRTRLFTRLSAERRKSFDEGYNAVLRRFAELDLDRQQTKADAKADEEKRQEQARQELERERANLAQQRKDLESRAETIASGFKRELASLDAQLAPLTIRQQRLEAQAAAIVGELARLEADIARFLASADLVEDPEEALRLRAIARRLDLAYGGYDVDLRAVQGELAAVAAQRITLTGQRQAAIARQRAQTSQIERRLAVLRRAERRISGQENKVNQPVSGNTAAVFSLRTRARAFATYEGFPFEEERARLLQSVE